MARVWTGVLDLGITIWVLRAIVIALLLGFAIVGLAPQAQDLLLDVSPGPWWYITLFLLSVFFVWAMPTHYAARLLVSTDVRYLPRVRDRQSVFLDWLQLWMPRLLGLSTFGAMLLGVGRSINNVPAVDPPDVTANARLHLWMLVFYLVLAAVVFWFYVIKRRGLARHPVVMAAGLVVKGWAARIAAWLPPRFSLGRRAGGNLGPSYLFLMFLAFTFAPFFAPVLFAEWFPRAIAIPFVFAGWTPLLAYASGLGRRHHVPVISLALIGSAFLTYLLGDNYSVRRINAEKHATEVVNAQSGKSDYALAALPRPLTQRLQLHEAVQLWKRANGCEGDAASCPRPLIVAASGGASRAGFFTASVIGKYLDDGTADFRKRLFAISSVSGSSVGAVMTVAALAASPGAKPCRDDEFWLLYAPSRAADWRTCLEALMSGDFLTPVFAGLVFRDTLRFLGVFGESGSAFGWSDRASLIEQSWERHFRRSLTGQTSRLPDCRGNLDCPFLALRPRETDGRVEWLPLLLLNGASVSTGQRVVTSIVDPWYRPGGKCPLTPADGDRAKCPVFDHAYDFHWLMGDESRASGWIARLRGLFGLDQPSVLELNDVRQSTAAHNSARFPLISPPGEVRNRTSNVVDRIVDGGYFENFGAQTAVELASAIRAVDGKLAPFVLVISNDPEIPTDDVLKAPDAGEGAFLTDLSAPAQTILNTRAARGTLALDGIVTVLAEELGANCAPYAAHVRVWPEYEDREGNTVAEGEATTVRRRVRPLSFSWWLSKPVQMRLHQQTEFKSGKGLADNQAALGTLSAALGPKSAGCATQPQATQEFRKYEGVRPLLQLQRQRP